MLYILAGDDAQVHAAADWLGLARHQWCGLRDACNLHGLSHPHILLFGRYYARPNYDQIMIAARQAKAAKRAETAIQSWRAGGALTDAVRNLRPMLLRVRAGVVETSGGASVPLADALTLFEMVEKGTAEPGRERVGAYTFTGYQGKTVRIGCHVIALDEARAVLNSTLVKAA